MAGEKENKPVVEEPAALRGSDKAKFDQLVKDKIAAGLPRSDAEEVARRQIEADKAAAK